MNVQEIGERLCLSQEEIDRMEHYIKKAQKSKKSYYCESCTGEYRDFELLDNQCPLCLSEGELEEIKY